MTPKEKGYFQARLKNRLHEVVLEEFMKSDLTQRDIAKELGVSPAMVSRLLGAPGNWEIETVSDLLLAMGCELKISVVKKFDPP